MKQNDCAMKHAYLILANDCMDQLCQLLKWLDDSRNDIYLHIDRKSRWENPAMLTACVTKSSLYILPDPVEVYWGDYSQIEAELLLLEYAVKHDTYAYYHILSGKCIPIKSQDYIHDFLQKNAGKEFVSVDNVAMERYAYRYKYYFPYLRKLKKPKSRMTKAYICVRMLLQKLRGINRVRGCGIQFKKGSNWMSITHEFAEHILSQRGWIRMQFEDAFCADEIFIQTLLCCSPFADHRYVPPKGGESNLRYIDWKRGNPYTFQPSDAGEIGKSDCLFARKVDNCEAARMIYEHCLQQEARGTEVR